MRVVIIGAGGHAQVVADMLLRAREAGAEHELIGLVDDNQALVGTVVMGVPVLGKIAELPNTPHDGVLVAIGDNQARSRLFASMESRGETIINAVHPSAVIAPDARLGKGVMICANAVVNPGSAIGDDVILNTGCTVDHHCRIEPHAHIGPGAHLGGEVQVGEGALIGIGSAVVPGRKVGRWAIVGAGAAVTRDIPEYSTAVGVPARVVKRIERKG